MEEFKDRLKRLRKAKEVTQESLGRAVHVSRSAIAKWEAGLGLPNEDSVDALCAYFQIDRAELFPDPKTEELLTEKNVELSRRKRVIVILIAALFALVALFSGLKIYDTVKKEREAAFLRTVFPTVTKMYFNRGMNSFEREVLYEEGHYVLDMREEFTKLYFEVAADDRIFTNRYTFTVQCENFELFFVEEVHFYTREENRIRNVVCATYIRPEDLSVTTLQFSKVTYSYVADGIEYKKDCAIAAEPLPIRVIDSRG